MSSAQAVTTSEEIGGETIHVTQAAQEKFVELLAGADDDVSAIRIFVSGGGCSGMTYGMTYTDGATPYDRVIQGDGYTLLVDAVALNYLEGCEIDFANRGMNQTFVFNNVFRAVGGSGACGGCGGGGCGA
jgi:iron-sulfur cluster insertion protein